MGTVSGGDGGVVVLVWYSEEGLHVLLKDECDVFFIYACCYCPLWSAVFWGE